MPRAEAGTTKALSNKLKSKGLQRLRWYCQACERQMRDENGFKCHTQSESHVRQMLLVGEDPRKYINDFSNQFQRDFLLQLRTAHGEKKILINHFYQEYIGNKEHVHMNSTKWPSLTEFAKFLGREGICRVEDTDKGLEIAWIDNSPEALRRQSAVRKKERQDKGDEEREQRLIEEQITRAKADADSKSKNDEDNGSTDKSLQRQEDGTIKLNLFSKPATNDKVDQSAGLDETEPASTADAVDVDEVPKPIKIAFGGMSKPKNVFASVSKKKNPLSANQQSRTSDTNKKPMSEAERIMKEEIERKRSRESSKPDGHYSKKQRVQ